MMHQDKIGKSKYMNGKINTCHCHAASKYKKMASKKIANQLPLQKYAISFKTHTFYFPYYRLPEHVQSFLTCLQCLG